MLVKVLPANVFMLMDKVWSQGKIITIIYYFLVQKFVEVTAMTGQAIVKRLNCSPDINFFTRSTIDFVNDAF